MPFLTTILSVLSTGLLGVLPILPGLVGLLSLLPALAAGVVSFWLGRKRRDARVGNRRWRWARFWLRQTPSLLVILAMFYTARWLWVGIEVRRTVMAATAAERQVSYWTEPRGGPDRKGTADDMPLPSRTPLAERWRFRPPGTAFYGEALPHGDRIYVVGSRGDVGTIFALDRHTGLVAWSCRPRGYRATFSSPVVADNVLYVGEGLHYTRNARLVAVAVAGARTGRVLWTFSVAGHIECTPTVVEGRIYFAAGDDGVYCVEVPTTDRQPKLVWHVPGTELPDVDTSVTVYQRHVYVGMGSGGNGVAVLDSQTGSLLARWGAPAPVRALPAVRDGTIAFSAGEGDFVRLGDQPAQLMIRPLYSHGAGRTPTGFTTQIPGTVLGSVAFLGTDIVFGCADGRVCRVDLRGAPISQWQSGAPIAGSLVVSDSLVVGHNRDGWLFGLSTETWTPHWRFRLGRPGNYVASPVAADGCLIIGTDEDGLLCVGSKPMEAS